MLLLLLAPMLWLGTVYPGSPFALLAQSFFSTDEFSRVIDRTPTLKTWGELLRPHNLDIIWRTVAMAALVTAASVVVAFPSPTARHGVPRARGRQCSTSGSCCPSGRATSSRPMPGS